VREQLQKILGPDGALSRFIPSYEERLPQIEMLGDVVKSLEENTIALIEAGTGVGKSMAYLLPSLLFAIRHKERILISTHTITLQEQLLHKDIPLAQKALGSDLKVVLVKGMSNYLCLRKLEEARIEKRTLSDRERDEISQIEDWAEATHDGSLSGLSIAPSYGTWERVCAETDTCSFRKCPFYDRCHFFKARKEAENAQILISNHSLLFADLALREENREGGLLPDYHRIILDEAHRVEDVATNFFASRVSYLHLMRLMGRLGSDKQGKIALLKDRIRFHYSKHTPDFVTPILSRLNIDIPAQRRELMTHLAAFFAVLTSFLQNHQKEGENKLRLLPKLIAHPRWKQEIIPHTTAVLDAGKRYLRSTHQILTDLKDIDDPMLKEKTEGMRHEIQGLLNRLSSLIETIEVIIFKECPSEKVRWIEMDRLKTMTNLHLIEAPLEIGALMASKLFNPFHSTILTSATVTTNQTFQFFRKRVGLIDEFLKEKTVLESHYLSPFDYASQVKLIIPQDMPDPKAPEFFDAAVKGIWDAIQASRGNAFVLFTSYSLMEKCVSALAEQLRSHRFPLFKQGEAGRKELLDQFRSTNYSVLFGTDSFWEGVDVTGEALRCVILVKLPFRVPTEPLLQARTELIQGRGEDPFRSYHLPAAIVKFKQGFGRLIRHKKDRGCIVCLDSRLIHRPYGRLFINSLPSCQQSIINIDQLKEEMKSFYKLTNYLIKNR
jgi:ATP-dependent DNA helicase DinG